MSLKVMVIGAGPGGLTLANGLVGSGVDVVVYERDPGPEIRAQGARVHFDDRGERALRECLTAPRAEFFRATVGEPSESMCQIADVDGRLEVFFRREFVGREGVPEEIRPGRPVSRRLLRRLLLDGVAAQVRFDRRLVRYELSAGGGVRAHFADGSTDDADVLVGADGIGSVVRGQLLPHARVVDTGMRWLGGKAPVTEDILATGLLELIKGSFSVSRDRIVVATVRFQEPPPVAAARLLPGFDPGDTGDHIMWAVLPTLAQLDGPEVDTDAASPGELWELARSLTRAAHPDLRLVVDQAWSEQTYCLHVGSAVPVEPWPAGPVTVLGDAIHAMPPVRGSGVNTALQDARRLAAGLAAVDRGQADLLATVAEYEQQMRHDGFAAVTASVRALEEVGIVR